MGDHPQHRAGGETAAGVTETIAAVATGAAPGGIGIVRISGPRSLAIARTLCAREPRPRTAHLCSFLDPEGAALDQGLLLYFPGPGSYTGEDVVELQGHGGSMAPQRVLRRVLELGARLAHPGEFTERAFLNGKLDLAQAEAVADLIASSSEASARAAMNSLQGRFSEIAGQLAAEILSVRMHCEAHIDFPEEELEAGWTDQLDQQMQALARRIREVSRQAAQGRNLVEGVTVLLAGPPNAGKSSLLNALSGMDSAIVTSTPGTTRDVLRESVLLGGVPITLLDTAGLRQTNDPIEQEGVRRSEALLARADHVLLVLDASRAAEDLGILATFPAGVTGRTTLVWNKLDLCPAPPAPAPGLPFLCVSALDGTGLDALRSHLQSVIADTTPADTTFSARARHVEALDAALRQVESARTAQAAGAGLEIVSEDLRLAHEELGRITGAVTSDDLLGEIFAGFCIGK